VEANVLIGVRRLFSYGMDGSFEILSFAVAHRVIAVRRGEARDS